MVMSSDQTAVKMTSTEPPLQTQNLQTSRTPARRAAQLYPATEREIWANTASRTPAETPRAPEEGFRVR